MSRKSEPRRQRAEHSNILTQKIGCIEDLLVSIASLAPTVKLDVGAGDVSCLAIGAIARDASARLQNLYGFMIEKGLCDE